MILSTTELNILLQKLKEKMSNSVVLFFHEDNPFSNWYPSKFKEGDVEFSSMEQYIMAMKALLFKDDEMYRKIMKSDKPRMHKRYGRRVKNFDEKVWTENNYNILLRGLTLKFSQNNKLKEHLLNTGNSILAEASPYDKIYGIGLSADNPNAQNPQRWKGQNLMGRALMEVRRSLV